MFPVQSAEQYHARTESEASTLGLLEDSFQAAVPAVAGLPFAIRGQVDVLGEPYGSEASSAVTALSAALHRLNLKCIPVLAGAASLCGNMTSVTVLLAGRALFRLGCYKLRCEIITCSAGAWLDPPHVPACCAESDQGMM